jgi:chloramphenicol-sensitive protein RarD
LSATQADLRAGIWYGVAAYGAWGLVPLYFKSVDCPAHEIVAHRVLWSFAVLAIIITFMGRWAEIKAAFQNRFIWLMLLCSGYLVAGNWYVYVYSATSGQITQASIGYFILPLVNAFAGVAFFKERLRPLQLIALAFAASGVLYMAVSLGIFPWIGFTLAVSFAMYGIFRKLTPVDGIIGLTIETILLGPTAITLLLFWHFTTGINFGHLGLGTDAMIACSGLVTTFPLVCFAQAIRRVPLVTIGFLQYLSPTIQLLVAVFVYHEAFTAQHQISFGLIWLGLLFFGWDGLRQAIPKRLTTNVEPVECLPATTPITSVGASPATTPIEVSAKLA